MRDCTEKSHLDFNNFWETVKELERLLDYTFICSGSLRGANDMPYVKRKEPVSSWIEQALHADRISDAKSREFLMCKISMLIHDLQSIEMNRPDLLSHYRNKFRRHTDNEFWGLRLEIDIASTLAMNEILFELGSNLPGGDCKHGDFVCGDAAIECTSIHASKIKRFNTYSEKISRAIRRKKGKSYCANNVALVLDMTNICYERAFVGDPVGDEELRALLKDEQTFCNYGAIIASIWFFNEDDSLQSVRYQNLMVREDSAYISPSLKLLLDNDLGLNQNLSPLTKVTWTGNY